MSGYEIARLEELRTVALGNDRPVRTFVGAHGSIRVDGDDEYVAFGPGRLQIANVARVEQVEDAVREDDSAPAASFGVGKRRRFVDAEHRPTSSA